MAVAYARRCYQREISFYKVVKWLKHKGRLGKAIQENMLNNLFTQLRNNILRLCKQRRKRKTTLQLIDKEIEYMNSFTSKPVTT